MKPSPITGDLGEFIVSELGRRGVALFKTADLPRLPATWRTITVEIGGAAKDVGAGAQGCSLDKVLAFCFSLLSSFRVDRPFSNDSDSSFWFSINGKQGNFTRTDTGLVVSFIAWGVSLTISESGQDIFIGFAEHQKSI